MSADRFWLSSFSQKNGFGTISSKPLP